MLKIRSAFHLTHMIRDLDAGTKLYQRIFQPPIVYAGYHAGENRDASFASVSDAYIELFAPHDAEDATPKSPGGRFIKRWGEGLANFGWLIDGDVGEAIRYCESKGYPLVYVAGSGAAPTAFFVHPSHAYGIMLEVAGGSIRDKSREEPGWVARWRDHPLGIERISSVSYGVRDLDGAVRFIQDLSDAPLVHRTTKQESGAEHAYLWVVDHMIELAQGVTDASPIGRRVREQGPRIDAITFKVKSAAKAADYLRGIGLRVIGNEDSGDIAIDPEDMLGARYQFTEAAIPHDPRDAGVA
jgi:catechol 2,3-dioxygenase-like lactoylglutathione lyase family enzyme